MVMKLKGLCAIMIKRVCICHIYNTNLGVTVSNETEDLDYNCGIDYDRLHETRTGWCLTRFPGSILLPSLPS